jgi:hypothetical protein
MPKKLAEVVSEKVRTVRYMRFPDTAVVECHLTMENGFTIVGQWQDLGLDDTGEAERAAHRDAIAKATHLELYLRFQRTYENLHYLSKLEPEQKPDQ